MSLIRRFDDCVRTCEIPFTKRDDMRDDIMIGDDIPEPWSRQWNWRKGRPNDVKFNDYTVRFLFVHLPSFKHKFTLFHF